MSLRFRLALALALLAAATTTLVCVTSYFSTRSRLYEEIDISLRETSRFLVAEREIGGLSPPEPRGRPTRTDGRDRAPSADQHIDRLTDTAVQILDRSGTPVLDNGAALPVSQSDVSVAASGQGTAVATASLGGVSYRIFTAPRGNGALQVARDLRSTERILESLRFRYIVTGLVASALAALLGWLVARTITRPLARLTIEAERIGSTSDLQTSVGAEGRDEVGRLATAFNRMTTALANSREQQQRLVQDAGHELRTPLTSLRTNIGLLRKRDRMTTEQIDTTVNDIGSELSELTDLVNELVELATDSRDDEPVQEIHLDRLGDRAAQRLRRRTGREVAMTLDGATCAGQPLALERALTNLLENAAKFDRSDLPIELRIENRRIEVRDHGDAIPAADLPRVFERFYRATAARSEPGSGLGLSIVADIARRHGGEVFAYNHPGGGAVVGFTVGDMSDRPDHTDRALPSPR